MKVLTDYNQLVGKTIAYAHMGQFAEQITLVTTDNEVLMVTFDSDEFDSQIRIYQQQLVIDTIKKHRYLREELDKLGIFNLEEYERELEKRRKEYLKREKKKREERDWKEYQRLKEKFENK